MKTRRQSHAALWVAVLAILIGCAWAGWARVQRPFDLAYEIDLAAAQQGRLDVTLRATGHPPRALRLVQSSGLFEEQTDGCPLTPLAAWNLTLDGGRGAPLTVSRRGRAWIVAGTGRGGALQYRVELPPPGRPNTDLRAHLCARAGGGLRATGFRLFLVPEGARVGRLSVRFTDGGAEPAGRLAVPWPGAGSPEGVVYTPADLSDLTDALIAWGDVRLRERNVAGCQVRLALRGEWSFSDAELERLVARVGEAEISFFGAPPHATQLVLVDVNPLPASTGFPYYGLHAGHSLLLLLDPAATWSDLDDNAASLIAHELFHGWLGEGIRQRGTAMNWFVEGATSWYAARLLVASGVWTARRAEEVVGARVDAHYRDSPLRGRETIAAAARGLLRDGETTRFAYAGSTLAARQLDAWLTERTGHVHPLDAVLRDLYARRAAGPLTRASLEAAVARACRADCRAWLDAHVYGNEPLPRPASLF